ncbi:MAG: hypothetical protein NZ959_12445 [Armatimonadetes bacterium]|nr:hypothetical protein [Armatimonadota bacterium]MDW8123075.1 hypothetical protein [Armatimonadota bacterium]
MISFLRGPHRLQWCFRLIVMLLTVSWAGAYPTSLNVIPTAEVLESGQMRLELEQEGFPSLTSSRAHSLILFQMGLGRSWEVGIDFYDVRRSQEPFLNAKFQIQRQVRRQPSLAVGVLNVGRRGTPAFYAAMSQRVGSGGIHLGAMKRAGRGDWLLGAEYPVGPRLWLLSDWTSERDGWITLGVYGEWASGFGVTVAYGRPNRSSGSHLLLVNLLWVWSW